LSPWRSDLNAILDEGKESASHAALAFVDCALAERNRKMAAQALTLIPAEGAQNPADNYLWPRDWYVGLVARSFGDTSEAQRAFTAARAITAKTVQDQPEYAPAWSALGAIDAGLGHKSHAGSSRQMPTMQKHRVQTCSVSDLLRANWNRRFPAATRANETHSVHTSSKFQLPFAVSRKARPYALMVLRAYQRSGLIEKR
jgi:hypothetical protein